MIVVVVAEDVAAIFLVPHFAFKFGQAARAMSNEVNAEEDFLSPGELSKSAMMAAPTTG